MGIEANGFDFVITKQFLKHFSVLETQVLELSNINQGRREKQNNIGVARYIIFVRHSSHPTIIINNISQLLVRRAPHLPHPLLRPC